MFKKPVQKEPEFRINDLIRGVQDVRLVGDNLEEVSAAVGEEVKPDVYPLRKILSWADKMELDVVEITPNANPPVVRIADYNKFLYQRKKRDKEIKANTVKTEIKEIRFGPTTDTHDFEFKLRHAQKFLQEACKVKAYVQFKGRAILFKDKGEILLLNFLKELEEFGTPESFPKLEGKRMIVFIAPKKKGKSNAQKDNSANS